MRQHKDDGTWICGRECSDLHEHTNVVGGSTPVYGAETYLTHSRKEINALQTPNISTHTHTHTHTHTQTPAAGY